MTRPYRKRGKVPLVPFNRQISTHHYSALQRYSATRGEGQGEIVERGLEKLPGFKQLLKEVKEAYATNQDNEQTQDPTEAAIRRDKAVQGS